MSDNIGGKSSSQIRVTSTKPQSTTSQQNQDKNLLKKPQSQSIGTFINLALQANTYKAKLQG